MSRRGGDRGLKTIFSFFLGLMLTAFFGVGVYTFYPSPEEAMRPQVEELSREAQQLRGGRDNSQLTPEEIQAIESLEDQQAALRAEIRDVAGGWARTTSVVLIILATLTMAVSLMRSPPVLGNGLLLGGVFTMVYGVGWIISSEATVARFVVMTVALVVTLGLGYLRFVRSEQGAAGAAAAVSGPTDGEVERRLSEVEDRLDRVAEVLGR
jgi:hypothetical protein